MGGGNTLHSCYILGKIDLVEGKIKIIQFDKNPRTSKTNKLEGITKIVFNLDELDNANNIENGKPSNILFMYHMTAYEDSMPFEPYTHQYKNLKNGELVSLALRMTYQKNNMTDGSETSVVLHIR